MKKIPKTDLQRICKKMDSRLKVYKKEKTALAKNKGYKYFNEYLYSEYGDRTAIDILKEMESAGILGFALSNISRVCYKIEEYYIAPPKPDKKLCKRCKKVPIADDNWWY